MGGIFPKDGMENLLPSMVGHVDLTGWDKVVCLCVVFMRFEMRWALKAIIRWWLRKIPAWSRPRGPTAKGVLRSVKGEYKIFVSLLSFKECNKLKQFIRIFAMHTLTTRRTTFRLIQKKRTLWTLLGCFEVSKPCPRASHCFHPSKAGQRSSFLSGVAKLDPQVSQLKQMNSWWGFKSVREFYQMKIENFGNKFVYENYRQLWSSQDWCDEFVRKLVIPSVL